jgi:hypothetical protein
MRRRRALPPLAIAAAAAGAVALPMAGLLAAPGDTLPDLRADPPANPYFQVYGDGRLLLRFDGFVTNVGAGPLDVTGNPQTAMYQRVQRGGGLANLQTVPVQYETADGHDHFHLMRIMRYSLRTSGGAEVAPGQKVGFCLYDYNPAANFNGTRAPKVYGLDRPGDTFCNQGNPRATYLNMGVGSGWRDDYGAYLALQWVDVSDTTPGAYRVAAEADPYDIVEESNENNPIALGPTVTVPGYVPRPIGPVAASGNAPTSIPLQADAFGSPAPVQYAVVQQPARGSVSIQGGTAVYSPGTGAPGTYTFTYSAAQSGSAYPRTRRTATVTLNVGTAQAAAVTISGAPPSMIAGTSAQLAATVVNATGGVTWSASAGTITPTGLYTAPATPPPGGAVTITARSSASPSAQAQASIGITPAPAPVPAPGGPGTGAVTAVPGRSLPPGVVAATLRGSVAKPSLKRKGRWIAVRVVPAASGRVVVTAIRAKRGVARCAVKATVGKRAACRIVLPKRFAKKPVRIAVALKARAGRTATQHVLSRP